MRLRFWHRIGLLVAIATVGLATVTVVTFVLGRRSESELRGIETRYVPLIELDRDLKTTLAQVVQAFEDAASAADENRLADADKLDREFVAHLHAGRATILDNDHDPDAVEVDFRNYFGIAREVSKAIVQGAPLAQLEDRVEAMRRAQETLTAHLQTATTPDRRRLAAAFTTARESQEDALRIEVIVALGALLLMGLLSWRIARRTVGALREVSLGVTRLAQGEFGSEIAVATGDEIGDLAREANRTAARLREYHEQTQRLLVETQQQAIAALESLRQQRETEQELRRAKGVAEAASRELEAFSYSVAHDLRAPLRGINGFSSALVEDLGDSLSPGAKDYLERIRSGATRMGHLIDALLGLSRVSRTELTREHVNLTTIVHEVATQLRASDVGRVVTWVVEDGVVAHADPHLLRVLVENLLGNAWKFVAQREDARIEFGRDGDEAAYFVRDNGAGFDMAHAEKLFAPFQRLHSVKQFAGTGIGLATVQRIVQRHGGKIWAHGAVNEGATFRFTLATT